MKLGLYKTMIVKSLLILIGVGGLTGCVDDTLYEENVGNGDIVEMSVGVSLPEAGDKEVLTRSIDGKLPLQIYDLMVFAFDAKGEIAQRYFFSNLKEGVNECDAEWSSDPTARLQADETASHISLLNLRVPSGKGYLMAVANVEILSTTLLAQLRNITTRNELLALQTPYLHYDSNASILSGGYMESATASIDSFNPSGEVVFRSGSLNGKIHLVSTAAAIRFNINGKGSGSKGGAFTLESYEFVNLPAATPLISQIGTKEEYVRPVTTGEIEVFEETGVNNYTFSYEQLEYLGKSEGIEDYLRRADWDQKASESSRYKVFTKAPSTAPYVILRGKYSGKSAYVDENGNNKEGNVEARVVYYIFLGHDSKTDPNDFSTRRNWEYVYNISINGINDITVEVNRKDNTVRQDAEGDVIVMDSDASHRFDAHYCQVEFSMTMKEIRELYNNQLLGFRVIVPAYGIDEELMLRWTGSGYADDNGTLGVYDATTGDPVAATSENYYLKKGNMDMNNLACVAADWLRFYQHGSDKKSTIDEISEPVKVNYSDKLKKVNSNNKPYMLTIYRFLRQLVNLAKSDRLDSESIIFTVFVQENYYGNNWNDRMVMNQGRSGTSGNVHWSQFVNKDDRKVLLFPTTQHSSDGASSYSNPRRVFSQRSIRTVYKPMEKTGYKAWGTESVEEFFLPTASSKPSWYKGDNWASARKMLRIAEVGSDDKRSAFKTHLKSMSYTSDDYARAASFNTLKGKQWTTYLNYNSKYLNNSEYRISGNVRIKTTGDYTTQEDMISACLGRNRDLDGDGVIDAKEIRWYVPGIRQLQALYVGNAGLPTEARLYQKEANEGKWVYKHYLSATRHEGDDTNAVLWAEEGPSTGQAHSSYAYGVHVRCVRDLGTNLSDAYGEWGSSFEVHKVNSGHSAGYININLLNDNCVRDALENKDLSGVVTTFSNSNRPARSFYYANKLINVGPTKTFSYSNGKTYVLPDWTSPSLISVDSENRKSETNPQKRSLCAENFGQGWRTPTISEIAIMYWAGLFERETNILSRTRYVFWNNPDKYGTDLFTGKWNDKGGRDPHSFSEGEFRLRYPWKNLTLPTAKDPGNITQITGHYGGILCVKDKF
ncbi:MAG: hypothetical protein K2H46_06575 [Muribaculaceae bacterium]|nr:hypothetical protein [Muribaculaceae bacterium]